MFEIWFSCRAHITQSQGL